MAIVLDFEKPIIKIEQKIEELKKMSEESGMDLSKEIKIFEDNSTETTQDFRDLQEGFRVISSVGMPQRFI